MATSALNPKDSMKSTWRTWDRKLWNFQQWTIETLGIQPTDLNREIPVHAKSDKVPYISHWEAHQWVLLHACWPLVLHYMFVHFTGKSVHPMAMVIFYSICFKANGIHEIGMLRNLGHRYGYFDGDKHERDQIPDSRARSVMNSLSLTSSVRPMLCVFLAYHSSQAPSLSWLLPLEIGLYSVILDFFFYWYHRCMHDFDSLWKYHRTHHLSKHPSPALSLYADWQQEIFDIAVIPLLAYGTMKLMGLPMGFYDWWICHQYVMFTELFGHSGLRIWITPPTTITPFLKLFDAELTTEDHDLHHRKGWKSSHNYGKQTLLWDRLFGTTHERYESVATNIDWNDPVTLF